LFFAFAALGLSACLRRWAFLDRVDCAALGRLCAYGVGLFLVFFACAALVVCMPAAMAFP
jgi:hypothetical protein